LKSVDTNVLARFLLNDDPEQSARAEGIVRSGVFVPLTVLLELGWLLRSRYAFERAHLCAVLNGLLDIPGINVDDEAAVRRALAGFARGGDFADFIHLVGACGSEAFVTFDKALVAIDDFGVPVELA
jgi:predicted nucleic-acid-binding protein